jgi:hypothetical protein
LFSAGKAVRHVWPTKHGNAFFGEVAQMYVGLSFKNKSAAPRGPYGASQKKKNETKDQKDNPAKKIDRFPFLVVFGWKKGAPRIVRFF